MIYHDISWYFLIFLDKSWFITIYHDISWFTAVLGEVNDKCHCHTNFCPIKHLIDKSPHSSLCTAGARKLLTTKLFSALLPTISINLIGAVLKRSYMVSLCIRKPVDLLSVSAQICNTPWCLWVTFRRPLSKLGSSCLGLSSPIRAQGIWDMQEWSAWSHEAVTVRLWCSTLMPLFSNGIQEAWLTADYNILGGTIFHV